MELDADVQPFLFQQPKKQSFLPQCTTIAYLHRPQKQFYIYLWPSCSFFHIKYKYILHNFLQKNNAAVAFRLHHSFKCSSCVLLSNCSNEMSMLTKVLGSKSSLIQTRRLQPDMETGQNTLGQLKSPGYKSKHRFFVFSMGQKLCK